MIREKIVAWICRTFGWRCGKIFVNKKFMNRYPNNGEVTTQMRIRLYEMSKKRLP